MAGTRRCVSALFQSDWRSSFGTDRRRSQRHSKQPAALHCPCRQRSASLPASLRRDYDTPDGTGVRDYIHVMDLAEGHAQAIPYVADHPGWIAVNLGCGRGYSVLEVIHAFEKASGRKVPYKIAPRRAGDIAANWCDPTLAAKLFGWHARYNINDMCRDAWRFEQTRAAELNAAAKSSSE